MTPKEKALELVAKYSRVLPMNQTTLLDHKNCALIAVDEMLYTADGLEDSVWSISGTDFLKEVKEEINSI